MVRNGQVGVHFDASYLVSFNPEPLGGRRGDGAGRPQNGPARDALTIDDHAVFIGSLDFELVRTSTPRPSRWRWAFSERSGGYVGKICGTVSKSRIWAERGSMRWKSFKLLSLADLWCLKLVPSPP